MNEQRELIKSKDEKVKELEKALEDKKTAIAQGSL